MAEVVYMACISPGVGLVPSNPIQFCLIILFILFVDRVYARARASLVLSSLVEPNFIGVCMRGREPSASPYIHPYPPSSRTLSRVLLVSLSYARTHTRTHM